MVASGRILPDSQRRKKGVSTKAHEGRRRATKRDGSAASAGLRPVKPARAPLKSKSDGRRRPPGARASRPHSTAVACRSASLRGVSLRCDTRPPRRRDRHGPGRSRVLAPLPVEPGGVDGRGCGKNCAGGTPALPGGIRLASQESDRRVPLAAHQFLVLFKRPFGSLVLHSYDPHSRTGGERTDHGRQSQPRRVGGRRRDERLTSCREVVAKADSFGWG